MWNDLSEKERKEYKKMILAFASLTEMFAQKTETAEDAQTNSLNTLSLSPIINSKYQETVFQKVFGASAEDIGNTSYDAAIEHKNPDNTTTKYLIGIKTFGYHAGQQKVAQFKANHNEWSDIINELRNNATDQNNNHFDKSKIDSINHELYLKLAQNIAELRNKRITSSEANLRGFDVNEGTDNVQSVYHVLMPSKKGDEPYIYVGETSYEKIDVDNLQILGCTSAKNPTNFDFTDGNHKYRYTSADSQLLMEFNNQDIVQEKWKVKYATNAYEIFSEIANRVYTEEQATIPNKESYSWLITNSKGEVERYSGFNGFFGLSPKNKLNQQEIKSKMLTLKEKYSSKINDNILTEILKSVPNFLLFNAHTKSEKFKKERMRTKLIETAKKTNNKEFIDEIYKLVYRPMKEMYIPFPNASKFHQKHPDFFGKGIGTLQKKGSNWKLVKPKNERLFTMVFEPSGDEMEMFISQDNGKAIESNGKQSILGEWLMNKLFMLDKYEPLTTKRLNEIGINGIRLTKYENDNRIHLSFIWIDSDNLPEDYIK